MNEEDLTIEEKIKIVLMNYVPSDIEIYKVGSQKKVKTITTEERLKIVKKKPGRPKKGLEDL